MVFIGFLVLVSYYARRLYWIYWLREHSYTWKEMAYSEDEMSNMNVTLGRYNSSLNFMTGMNNLPEEMDILNNPYI